MAKKTTYVSGGYTKKQKRRHKATEAIFRRNPKDVVDNPFMKGSKSTPEESIAKTRKAESERGYRKLRSQAPFKLKPRKSKARKNKFLAKN